jgi:hypothetical protein
MRLPAVIATLTLAALACTSSSTQPNQCAPNTMIVASGTLGVIRSTAPGGDVSTEYVLSQVQAADFFNSGALTVTAGDADGGPGSLDPRDPVVLVKMDPSTDEPGTYALGAVHAQIAYCPTVDAKLVVQNGSLTGCAPSGTPVTHALDGTLTVNSASDKSLSVAIPPGHHDVALDAKYGTQAQQCN